MNKRNRILGLLVCILILGAVLMAVIFNAFIPDIMSLMLGLVVGWGLRETLVPKEKD